MISPAPRSHKSRAVLPPLLLLMPVLLATLLLTGCGGDADRAAAPGTAAVDAAALDAWLDLADRLAAGRTPAAADYDRLYDHAAYQRSFGDSRRPDFSRPRMERALVTVFAPDARPDRTLDQSLVANYRYLARRHDDARVLGRTLAGEDLPARILAEASPLLPADAAPDTLRVLLMAATPSVSWSAPDALIVDAGLALAAEEHLPGLLAAALYRQLAPAADPTAAPDGRAALIAALAQLQRRGVAAHLQGGARPEFDPTHSVLGAAPAGDPARTARQAMDRLQAMLSTLVDPAHADVLRDTGRSVDSYLRPGNLYDDLGAAMAARIHAHLGTDGWRRAAAGDPLAWYRAFQEAARAAQGPDPLPPFPAADWTRLQALLDSPNPREVTR